MYTWSGRFDVRISLIYGTIATLWIIGSDYLVGLLTVENRQLFAALSQLKGLGFVAVTTIALFSVLAAELQKQMRLEQALQDDIRERKAAEGAEREQRLLAEAMRDSLAALTTSHDVDEVLRKLLDHAATVVASEAGSILLFHGDTAHVVYLRGFTPEAEAFLKDYQFPIESLVYQKALLHREPYFAPDTKVVANWITLPATTWIRSSLGVPIEMRGTMIGLLVADSAKPHHFQPKDVEKLQTFARYASLALENADHVRQLEEKVAERTAELQAAKERVEAILNNSHDGILMIGPDLTIKQTNPSGERLLACPTEACFPTSLLDFVAEEERTRVIGLIDKVRRTKLGTQFEVRAQRVDRVGFDAELSIGYINEDGLLVCTIRDVTERKRAEEALRESEDNYRRLVATMHGGLMIANTNETITYVNDRFCELLGYTREEILQLTPYSLIDPLEKQKLDKQMARRRLAESSSYEILAKRKDGQSIYLLVAGAPLLDKQGVYIGSVAVATDITAQKQAEATLRQALTKERELGELKSRFVSMASHEFRTPLATILALSETISAYRQRMTDGQIDQRLNKIREQIHHLKEIIDDVLLLTRMQAKQGDFNPTPVDLDALCRSIISEFASQPDVAYRLAYVGDSTSGVLHLDSKLMRRIISNLLSNAIKYSSAEKPVQLHLQSTATTVVLQVRDEGIGIPEADQPHLFEPFHRAANVGAIAGTGLGLVLTKEAVTLHHGTVTVESQLGVGTTFTVTIPIRRADTPTAIG